MGSTNSFFAPWVDPTDPSSRTGGASGSAAGGWNVGLPNGQQAPPPPATNTTLPWQYNSPDSGTATGNTSTMMAGNRNQGRTTGGETVNSTPDTAQAYPNMDVTNPRAGLPFGVQPPSTGNQIRSDNAVNSIPGTIGFATNQAANIMSGGATPPQATAPPGSIPKTNPYVGDPFSANPGYTGPNGSGGYNPQTFSSLDYANSIAKQYGGTVVSGADTSMLGAPGSPYQTNQPQNMVRLANGTVIDPAAIARVYSAAQGQEGGLTNYQQALIQDILGGSTGEALNKPGFNGVNQTAPISSIYQHSNIEPNANPMQFRPDFNPFNVGTQYPTNSPYGGNTNGQVPSEVTPLMRTPQTQQAPQSGGIDWSNLNAQTLPMALQMLQAYSQMGNGAGNPTGVNSNGQLGQILQMLLSGMGNDQSLYTRRRQYPQFA